MELIDHYNQWCDEFQKSKCGPLSEKISKIFLSLLILEKKNTEIPPDFKKQFMYQVLTKRAKSISLKMNVYSTALLALLSDRPGMAVMYLYYLKSKTQDDSEVTMATITNLFPLGFPSDDEMSKLWEKQKIGSTNMLDLIEV